MKPYGLNENHLRRLATSMTMVDAAATRILDLLDQNVRSSSMTVVDRSSLPLQDQVGIREMVGRLQVMAGRFAAKYDLGPQPKDLRQSINAQISHVWTLLENTRSKRMKGMGRVPEEAAKEIDTLVNEMLALVGTIMQAVKHY